MLFIIIILILVTITIIKIKYDKKNRLPYDLNQIFFNTNEKNFYLELKKSLSDKYHLFPKVRIIDFIDPISGEDFINLKNEILTRRIDFLVCNEYFKPILAIELSNKSQDNENKIEVDDFKKKLFKDVNLHFKTVRTGDDILKKVEEIKNFVLKI